MLCRRLELLRTPGNQQVQLLPFSSHAGPGEAELLRRKVRYQTIKASSPAVAIQTQIACLEAAFSKSISLQRRRRHYLVSISGSSVFLDPLNECILTRSSVGSYPTAIYTKWVSLSSYLGTLQLHLSYLAYATAGQGSSTIYPSAKPLVS